MNWLDIVDFLMEVLKSFSIFALVYIFFNIPFIFMCYLVGKEVKK